MTDPDPRLEDSQQVAMLKQLLHQERVAADTFENALAQSLGELKHWREWARFVYTGGGTPIDNMNDTELRAAVCQAHDDFVNLERREAQLTIGQLREENQRIAKKERREFAWAEEYMARSRNLELQLEQATQQLAEARAAHQGSCEALELAEKWLANCTPIVDFGPPYPLPAIRKVLAALASRPQEQP